jgi:hypothetical protein
MPRYTIPNAYADGIAAIRREPEEAIRAILAALSTVSPSLGTSSITGAISAVVASVPQSEIEVIVEAVFSLYNAFDSSDIAIELFVQEICKAMEDSKNKDLHFDGDSDRERFKNRLTQLLSVETFRLASKALSLRNECAHIFCNGRIMTDARPVYGIDVSLTPRAALILHSFRLGYHEGTSDIKEFYFTFDDNDLKEMRDLLDRAELKSKSLTAALKASGIAVITAE